MADTIRLVPKTPEPEEETEELVEREGWVRTEDDDENVVEWKVPDSKTVVRWVFDDATQVQFFVVEGPQRKDVARTLEDAIEMLHVDDFEAYLDQFETVEGLMQGLYAVGAAAPERPDSDAVELLERYMEHDDPLVRAAALYAAAITRWQELLDAVRRRLDDPDPDVREAAEDAVDVLTGSE